jgi:hypothetical protein
VAILLARVSFAGIATGKRDLAQMRAATDTIHATVPAGGLLFTDFHTGLILSYYLGGNDFFRENPHRTYFWKMSAGGYRLIGSHLWAFNASRFSSELQRFIEAYRLPPGQAVWIVHIGREIDPALALSQLYPAAALPHRFRFGEIAIVEIRLP